MTSSGGSNGQADSGSAPHAARLSADTDPAAITPSHRRLVFLDCIRGIAAFAVLVQHFGSDVSPRFERDARMVFDWGQFGVVAFFLVSGFIIPFSIERYQSMGRFWRGRFFRLYPLYWFSMAAALAMTLLHRYHPAARFAVHPVAYWLLNMTMIQHAAGIPDAIGSYWTLALELIFYAMCSVLWAGAWLRQAGRVAVAFAAVLLTGGTVYAFARHGLPAAMQCCLLLTCFVGTTLFYVDRGVVAGRWLWVVNAAALVTVGALFYLRFVRFPEAGKLPVSIGGIGSAWIAAYAFVFGMYALRSVAFPGWLQWLGRISYSLYLMHELVAAAVPHAMNRVLWIAISTLLTLLVSWITYRSIERPAMRL